MILRDLQPAILSPVLRQSRVPSPALGGSNCFPRLIPAHYFCSLTRWHHNGACGSRSDQQSTSFHSSKCHQHTGQETNSFSDSAVICRVSGTDDSLSAWFKRAPDVTEPDTVYFSLLCLLHSLNASLEKKNRKKAIHWDASCFFKKGNQFLLELRMQSAGPE